MLIERGWVTVLLQKPEKGPNPFNRAFVLTYDTEEDPWLDAVDQIDIGLYGAGRDCRVFPR